MHRTHGTFGNGARKKLRMRLHRLQLSLDKCFAILPDVKNTQDKNERRYNINGEDAPCQTAAESVPVEEDDTVVVILRGIYSRRRKAFQFAQNPDQQRGTFCECV